MLTSFLARPAKRSSVIANASKRLNSINSGIVPSAIRMSSSAKSNTVDLTAGKLFNLDGKVALVTGGATGIGLMCSQALAANGAKVYITGRHIDALRRAAELYSLPSGSGGNGMLIPLECDVTSKSSIMDLYQLIKAKENELHVLVNNAGISGPKHAVEKADESADSLSKELLDHSFQDWQDVFATNVIGPFFMAATFLPLLAAATKNNYGFSGTVANISSISGITKTTQHHIPYNVSKSAAIQLTYMLAQEYSKAGVKVRVNSIAPGVFPSGMTSEVDSDQKSKIAADGYREEKGIRAGRPGRDADMAQALLALVTNQYISGEILKVDGGYLLGNQ